MSASKRVKHKNRIFGPDMVAEISDSGAENIHTLVVHVDRNQSRD